MKLKTQSIQAYVWKYGAIYVCYWENLYSIIENFVTCVFECKASSLKFALDKQSRFHIFEYDYLS